MSEYNLVMLDQNAKSIGSINATGFSIALKENTIGALVLTMLEDFGIDQLPRDTMFEVWRKPNGGEWGILGNTRFFLRKATMVYNSPDNNYWDIACDSALGILARRIVGYKRTTSYADKTLETGANGTADDLIKAYARENFGTLATDTDRDLSTYLTIDADTSEGYSTEKEAAYMNVLEVIDDLAENSANNDINIYYDVVNYGSKFRLFTKIDRLGVDRTRGSNSPVIFSTELGNITDVKLETDYSDEKNFCYVGGENQDALRLIEEVSDITRIAKSPYNRAEVFHDARELGVPSVLQEEGSTRLEQHRPKIKVSARTVDTNLYRFGKDYDYGDTVTVSVAKSEFTCHVTSVTIKVTGGKEDIDIRLEGEQDL